MTVTSQSTFISDSASCIERLAPITLAQLILTFKLRNKSFCRPLGLVHPTTIRAEVIFCVIPCMYLRDEILMQCYVHLAIEKCVF